MRGGKTGLFGGAGVGRNGSEALMFHLGSKRIGAILLGQEDGLAAGAAAQRRS